MCLAIPALVESIDEEKAVVSIEGVRREISIQLIPEAEVGDYVLLHTGFAIGILDEIEALQTLEMLRQVLEVR
jgi:hydrogenase expression/formation protein HypC